MSDKLVFYSGSKGVEPFSGSGEINVSGLEYQKLIRLYDGGHKDFRKTLSNFHIGDFEFEGKTYHSIEHAYHAEKYRAWSRDERNLNKSEAFAKAEEFVYPNTPMSMSDDATDALSVGRELRIPKEFFVSVWNEDSGISLAARRMEAIAYAKYSTHGSNEIDVARDVLMATYPAQLWHFLKRKAAGKDANGNSLGKNLQRFTHMEKLRLDLIKYEVRHNRDVV